MNEITIRFIEVYKYLLETKKVSNPSHFAKTIGVSTSMMNEILKERTNAGINPIQNTVKTFTSCKKYIHTNKTFIDDFTNEYINRELKEIAKLLGIRKKISFHVARHTFATNFLICGGRVEHLQKILGHSKITDTMIYVHIVENITDIQIHNMDDILIKKPLN